jgi:uncharacterized protein
MFINEKWSILSDHIAVMISMAFGSFVAGSSPEGSAAVVYPIFTLLLEVSPSDARNFAFAIQSIGMTAASVLIISTKIKVEWQYIKYVSISGALGLIFGMYSIAPYIQPTLAKLSFVSIWVAFALIMIYQNYTSKVHKQDQLPFLKQSDVLILVFAGFIGGIVSSIFGTGINMLTFCLLVVHYNLNEKIATPSSIIIMTIETIIGFFYHHFIFEDITTTSYNMWLSSIPIVVFFAPLGTYVMSKLPIKHYSFFLYTLFIVQYVGAIYVLRPSLYLQLVSFTIIVFVFFIFRGLLNTHFRSEKNTKW